MFDLIKKYKVINMKTKTLIILLILSLFLVSCGVYEDQAPPRPELPGTEDTIDAPVGQAYTSFLQGLNLPDPTDVLTVYENIDNNDIEMHDNIFSLTSDKQLKIELSNKYVVSQIGLIYARCTNTFDYGTTLPEDNDCYNNWNFFNFDGNGITKNNWKWLFSTNQAVSKELSIDLQDLPNRENQNKKLLIFVFGCDKLTNDLGKRYFDCKWFAQDYDVHLLDDLDEDQTACERYNFDWADESCCGDDNSEHYTELDTDTKLCCDETELVDGECPDTSFAFSLDTLEQQAQQTQQQDTQQQTQTQEQETPYSEPETSSDLFSYDFLVNTRTEDLQEHPSIDMDSQGNFIITWESQYQEPDNSLMGIFAKRFDSNGNELEPPENVLIGEGNEFLVNTYTSHNQGFPIVKIANNGDFIVAWHSVDQDGDGFGIYLQRFNSDGEPLGDETQVNSITAGSQYHPDIGIASNGNFVVTWVSREQGGGIGTIYAQMFDSNGDKIGDQFQVNTETTNQKGISLIATGSDGRFVIVWPSRISDLQNPNVDRDIFAQVFDSNGNKIGTEFIVNTRRQGDQANPDVVFDSNNNFIVTWFELNKIFAQKFDSDGTKIGDEIEVSDLHGSSWPHIALMPDNGFIVTWHANPGVSVRQANVYAQELDSNLEKVGDYFKVNEFDDYYQGVPMLDQIHKAIL